MASMCATIQRRPLSSPVPLWLAREYVTYVQALHIEPSISEFAGKPPMLHPGPARKKSRTGDWWSNATRNEPLTVRRGSCSRSFVANEREHVVAARIAEHEEVDEHAAHELKLDRHGLNKFLDHVEHEFPVATLSR